MSSAPLFSRTRVSCAVALLVLMAPAPIQAEAPPALTVARRIDQLIDASLQAAKVPASPRSDDAEFQRRVSLDLTGRLPPPDRAAAFLDSTEPDKRARLIDDLLASQDFGRHWARYWAELFVKRDGEQNKRLKSDEFRAWLAEQFNQGRGWDQIVTAMLTVDDTTASGFFFQANRLSGDRPSPAKVVGAAANLFLGIQFQCAECHDHPFTDAWRRDDFWGLAAFFGRTRFAQVEVNKTRQVKITEEDPPPPDEKTKGRPMFKPPVNGVIDVPDPLDAKKISGTVAAKFLGGDAPKMSEKGPHRPQFAAWLTAPANPWFARAAVNRYWAALFARGLVNPLDDMGPDSEPTHPELLAYLAEEFRQSGHDLKHLLRAVCNSAAYQRSSRALPENRDHDGYARMRVKFLHGEVLLKSLDQVLGVEVIVPPVKDKNKEKDRTVTISNAELFDTAVYDDDPANYSYGAPQLLRLMNAEIPRRSPAVIERLLLNPGEPADHVERLFLLTLSRRPSAEEKQELVKFVQKHPDPARGYAGVLWILLTGAEFVANH
ncbi:MAG: DUF1549 domain-containing protein [Planctomycetia bacterium]|nr:DUF1549 domain-containing protein [Planctomycetia bacterium]